MTKYLCTTADIYIFYICNGPVQNYFWLDNYISNHQLPFTPFIKCIVYRSTIYLFMPSIWPEIIYDKTEDTTNEYNLFHILLLPDDIFTL